MDRSTAPAAPGMVPPLILLCLGLIWGGTTVLAKFVGMSGVPSLGYAFWVTFGAGTLLLGIGRARGKTLPLAVVHVRYYVVCGLLGSAIPTTAMFFVLIKIPAGLMSIILATVPLFTYLFAIVARLERHDMRRAIGIGLGFTGTLLILLPRGSLPDSTAIAFVALAFVTPAFYALNNVYAARHRPADSDSLMLAAGMLCAAGLWLLPAVLVTDSFYMPWQSDSLVAGLVLAHVVSATLAFSLFFVLLLLAGPVYLSLVAYVVTLAGIVFGMWIFTERHSPWIWAALALVFGGVALVNARQSARSRGRTA